MKIEKNAQIKKISKEYKVALNKEYAQTDKYERACAKSNCYLCDIFDAEGDLPFEKRHQSCGFCKHGKKVYEEHLKVLEEREQVDALEEKYARIVFLVLSEIKPDLYYKAKKKTVSWDDAFPARYEDVPKSLHGSLVALIEEDGGRYSLK